MVQRIIQAVPHNTDHLHTNHLKVRVWAIYFFFSVKYLQFRQYHFSFRTNRTFLQLAQCTSAVSSLRHTHHYLPPSISLRHPHHASHKLTSTITDVVRSRIKRALRRHVGPRILRSLLVLYFLWIYSSVFILMWIWEFVFSFLHSINKETYDLSTVPVGISRSITFLRRLWFFEVICTTLMWKSRCSVIS